MKVLSWILDIINDFYGLVSRQLKNKTTRFKLCAILSSASSEPGMLGQGQQKNESTAFAYSILREKTTVLNFLQSFAGIPPGTCLFTPLSLTSLSLASISQILGGTSSAGEQLKNPCGFKHEHQQKI